MHLLKASDSRPGLGGGGRGECWPGWWRTDGECDGGLAGDGDAGWLVDLGMVVGYDGDGDVMATAAPVDHPVVRGAQGKVLDQESVSREGEMVVLVSHG